MGGDTNVESMKQISQETHDSSMISMWSRHEPRIQPWIVCRGCPSVNGPAQETQMLKFDRQKKNQGSECLCSARDHVIACHCPPSMNSIC